MSDGAVTKVEVARALSLRTMEGTYFETIPSNPTDLLLTSSDQDVATFTFVARNSTISVALFLTLLQINAGQVVIKLVETADGTSKWLRTIGEPAIGAWAASTAYTIGTLKTNGGNLYQVTTAGTSAASGGPAGGGAAITDGTVVWRYIGVGSLSATNVTGNSTVAGAVTGLTVGKKYTWKFTARGPATSGTLLRIGSAHQFLASIQGAVIAT